MAAAVHSSNLMGTIAVHGTHPTVTIPIHPATKKIPIKFSVAFDRCPSVHLALSMIDIENSANMLLNCEVAEITKTGCVIKVWSWSDSKVWGCHVSWFASDNPKFLCGSVCSQLSLKAPNDLEKEVYVRFDRPFAEIPSVVVGLKALDVGCEHNARISVFVKEGTITREGFTLIGKTWLDTVVYGADVTWMATTSSTIRFVTFAEPWGDFYAPLRNGDEKKHRKIEKEIVLSQPPLGEGHVQGVPTGFTHLDTDRSHNARVQCNVEFADRYKAKVSMSSWWDSITHMAHASAVVALCSADWQFVDVQRSIPTIGSTVALYGTSASRFVQMCTGGRVGILIDEVSTEHMITTLWRKYERFFVIDAGDKLIGLYCVAHRRFLHLWSDGTANGGDGEIAHLESVPEYARFRIKIVADGKVAVYGQKANRFLRMCVGDYLGQVDGHGGITSFDTLPDNWAMDHFLIVDAATQQFVDIQRSIPTVQLPEDFELDGDFNSARLGAGYHGQTFRVKNKLDHQIYCLKQFFKADNPSILREIRNLAHLPHHDNIIRYYSTRKLNNELFLQLDYIKGRTMHAYLGHGLNAEAFKNRGESKRVRSWVRQLFDGLAHLHTKMAIFVVKSDPPIPGFKYGMVKIVDMGNAREVRNEHEEGPFSLRNEGSLKYFSPERRTAGSVWGAKDDVWAVGCIAAELAIGREFKCPDFGLPENPPSIRARSELIAEVGTFSPTIQGIVNEVLSKLRSEDRKSAEEIVKFIPIDDV